VLSKLQSGDVSWENDVPPQIVEAIKRGKMFGCRKGGGVDGVTSHHSAGLWQNIQRVTIFLFAKSQSRGKRR